MFAAGLMLGGVLFLVGLDSVIRPEPMVLGHAFQAPGNPGYGKMQGAFVAERVDRPKARLFGAVAMVIGVGLITAGWRSRND